ncbi:FUSC family protein [Paracoccus cavernae]|uniref:FUSC family protein n=2 Tax=Paracoccus cavernae TaxID=1571207 RepID=A0ABT8DCF6_9RHOB|nr:FUSC family protein [Paracoccus cavernae]
MAASGGALGYLAFVFVFPTDARARRKSLWSMIKRDLQEIARMRRLTLAQEEWRLSFCARFLKIAYWASLEGGRYEKAAVTMHKGFVTMHLAEVVFLLKRLDQRADLAPSIRRAVHACLNRIAATSKDSDRFLRTFTMLAHRLAEAGLTAEAALIDAMAAELTELRRIRKA